MPFDPLRDIVILDRTAAGKFLLSTSPEKGPSISHVVSIGDPGEKWPAGLTAFRRPRLRLEFHDIWDDEQDPSGILGPKPQDVERLLSFLGQITRGRTLYHCYAGVSRSTAAAFTHLCMRMGSGAEREAMDLIYEIRPSAYPNKRIVQMADEILGRRGAMVDALG